jgi:hypothetical protein
LIYRTSPAITLQCRIDKNVRLDLGDAPAEVINAIVEVGRCRIPEDFAKSVVIIGQQGRVNVGAPLVNCRPLAAGDKHRPDGQVIAAFYAVKKTIGKVWFHYGAIAARMAALVKLRQPELLGSVL